jgi:integrase
MENTDPLPSMPPVLGGFAERFLDWVSNSRLEEKTRKFYRNGWRLLKATSVAALRVDQITSDCAEQLKFPGSAANANCALRTLRRMLHKAEEWKVIGHAPKIKMMKEHGRHLRLDDEAEKKLIVGASDCKWRPRTRDLFRDIVILMRDTGMRNERELYQMRIENLDWQNRVIFVPDSKTPEGRRLVPMSGRVFETLQYRCATNALGENNLADMYLRGDGVPQDNAAAFRWFRKSAVQGHTGARIKLGYMYAEGRGTGKDPEAAYAWITAASLAQDPRGKDPLRSLETVLKPEQIARARQRASSLLLEREQQLSAKAFAQ